MGSPKQLVPAQLIESKIYLIRAQKVMLSRPHLAGLYGVKTRALVQAVKRNIDRFPADFMFQLTEKEFAVLKSQIVISSWGGSRRARPYAFTEQGVAMLSSVLNRLLKKSFYTGCLKISSVAWLLRRTGADARRARL